jgi:hypothetical protein
MHRAELWRGARRRLDIPTPASNMIPVTTVHSMTGRTLVFGVCLAGLLALLPGVAPAQLTGLPQARRDAAMQQCRQIGQMLFSYATDHLDAPFPDGKSSTEIFQKLIDGNYCTDPMVFFLPLPGKSAPAGAQKLKPENVGFDVTSGVDSDAPGALPVVFTTGYKVSYVPGGTAVPLAKPFPAAIVVFYKDTSAKVLFPAAGSPDGSIANFVPANFDSKGKAYTQLTPDGAMP